MTAGTSDRMIRIMAWVLAMAIGPLAPKAAAQSENIRLWHLSTNT
jgi:hypothetical protein